MLKNVVMLDGVIINVGDWEYQIQPFEIEPPQYNEAGEIIQEGVYEDRPTNPLPEGATIEQRDMEYDSDRGWYVVGTVATPTDKERLAAMESALLTMMGL